MRIRALKPMFFKDEVLCSLPPVARIAFAGLWCCADREGRLEDRPKLLKAEIFPYEPVDFDHLLELLAAHGFVQRYRVGGKPYLVVLNFRKHQRPRPDEYDSEIPSPDGDSDRPVTAQRPYNREQEIGNKEGEKAARGDLSLPFELKRERKKNAAQQPEPSAAEVERFYELFRERTSPPIVRPEGLTRRRERSIACRLKERPLSEWAEIFDRVQASAFCRGENDRGWRASLDWIIGSPDVALKILEGRYDTTRAAEPSNRAPGSDVWTRYLDSKKAVNAGG